MQQTYSFFSRRGGRGWLAALLLALAPVLAWAQATVLTGPTGSGTFGTSVTVLANGNYVVTDPTYSPGGLSNVGAVYLYDGRTNTLVSTLTGSQAGDRVGISVTALANGNFVVRSSNWANGGATSAGAATWGSGTSGVSGVVSAANSLVGSQTGDQVGTAITGLPNGNYVVTSPYWASYTGAATWGSGTGGVTGTVSATNSLVGAQAGDQIGRDGITVLPSGNYVVISAIWQSNKGAITWGSGTSGVSGVASAANSLVGSQANDNVGFTAPVVLPNGNYVVSSSFWGNSKGAVTWGSGTSGVSGVVSAANSLVGSQTNERVGSNNVFALGNGNYVVRSPFWGNSKGAVTWGSGTSGVSGVVSAANSLVGSQANDQVGAGGIALLPNGDYVVGTPNWADGATTKVGAATWCNGTSGSSGPVSTTNSLTGSQANDQVGTSITALANGNYVVGSFNWSNGATASVGAATWISGATGTSGVVSAANSLVGAQAGDQVGSGIMALANGNYVVSSFNWANGAATQAGAVTWANGTSGLVGIVSTANSLVGSQAGDIVSAVVTLPNGNYVVYSPNWANGSATRAGAVTWCNGATGRAGAVSSANSLVGTQTNDQISSGSIFVLANGNYLVRSQNWNNGAATQAGAVTWGSGTSGVTGVVSATNSCVGTQPRDRVGFVTVALSDGNYYLHNIYWTNGSVSAAGALTPGNGSTGTVGAVTACNSIVGNVTNGGIRLVPAYRASTGTLFGGLPGLNQVQLGVSAPPAPTGAASQSFAAGATVADLAATGTAVQWYATATGGSPLAGTTALVDGTTYYAGQTVGGCESLSRLAVVASIAAPDLTVSTGTLASPTTVPAGTYGSLTITGTGAAQLGGAVVVNTALSVQSGGTLLTACQPLSGAGTFSLAAGATLGICDAAGISSSGATGAVQLTGTRFFSPNASYLYNGAAAQVTGTGLPSQVRNLTTTNASDVTLTQATSATQVVTVAGAGNLALNGQALTLLSSASGTALIVNGGTGLVTGSTGVAQRYLSPANLGLGYRHYSAPVAGSTVADLATTTFTPTVNAAYNASATPGTVTPFPTVFGYDQSRLASTSSNLAAFDKGWYSPAAASTPLAVGQGYTVNLAGTELVDFTGTFTSGPQTVALGRGPGASAGLALVGNPYPAPLDWSRVQDGPDRTGLDATIWVFQSSGPYADTYRTYTNGLGGTPIVPMAQGFFVRVTPGQSSGSLTLRDSHRLTAPDATPMQRTAADPRPLVQLELRAGNGTADVLYAYAEAGASPGLDSQFDAAKLPNPSGLNLSSAAASGERLAIDGRAAFTAATALPLQVGVPAEGSYSLVVSALSNLPTGLTPYLRDAATGQTQPLAVGQPYAFTVSNASTLLTNRFELVFAPQQALAAAPAALAQQVTLYPNPAAGSAFVTLPASLGRQAVPATLVDALGRPVRTLTLPAQDAAHALDLRGLASGVYLLRLDTPAGPLVRKLTVE